MATKPLILIVDDEPKNLKLLEANLIPEDYDIIKASNGKEALDILDKKPIDLVLLDIMMPEMDGFEVTKRIRASEKNKLLPIVLVTALRETEDRIRGIESGCDDFISKPFDSNEILARVKTLLKLSYLRNQLFEKEKFEYIIDNIDDGIVILDKNLKITNANKKASQYLIVDTDSDNDIFSYLSKYNGFNLNKVKEEIEKKDLSFIISRKETDNTEHLHLEINTKIINSLDNQTLAIVMVIRNITDSFNENKMKDDFLSLISHKLRTPMTILLPNLEMMQDGTLGELNEKQSKSLNTILNKTYNLNDNIEKLVLFTTVMKGDLNLDPESFSLCEYLPKIIEPLEKRTDKKIKINLHCNNDISISMNETYIDTLFYALLDNAIKFCDKDIAIIDLSIKKENNKSIISIKDNGPGIPPEHQNKIFDKFYQIEKYFTGNVPGLGLGLYLSKKIVEKHNGAIELKSELGKGAEFILTF